MTEFRAAHASGSDRPEDLLARCLEGLMGGELAGANLGFVYVSDAIAAALPAIVEVLKAETGVEDWVGTVGLGVCATGHAYYDEPAIAALVGAVPEGSFAIVGTLARASDGLDDRQRYWVNRNQPPFGIVHGDPFNGEVPAILDALGEASGGFLIGGLSASRSGIHQLAGEVTRGGVSGVLLGPEVAVATGLSQGCMPIGPVHTVTEGINNVVMTLDDRPALEVFEEDAGELLARDLARAARYIHPAFPVAGSDTGDYMVRNLTGVDRDRGWIAVGENVEMGDRMMFCRRDPNTARADLERMLAEIKGRIAGPPKGGLYVSCVARGPHMFGDADGELAMIERVLGAFPLAGFYANGEISHNRLYGYTGVLALFL